jgi:CRISPR type III-B/RAMP module-associated protein Cmr5
MQSKSQQYSEAVYKRIAAYINNRDTDEQIKRKYKSLCKRSGGVLRMVGLIQFLTFLQAKAQKESEVHHQTLLEHIQQELNEFKIVKSNDINSMLSKIRELSLPNYMHTTKEVLKFLQWHKRMSDILIQGTADESVEE